MRILSIDNVKANMRLAKNVYSAEGNILLAEGARLTGGLIQKLRQFGISSLYIADKRIGKIEIDELIKIQTKNKAIKISKEVMTHIRKGMTLNGEKVYKVVADIMEDLFLNRNITYSLVEIRAMNDYHFSHNVTVCVLSIMTGIALNYDDSKLRLLGVGAILHDIGKARIPAKILNKKGKLSPEEYAVVRKHSQLGYNILESCKDIHSASAFVAWQHHERFDGSGYPLGLKGTEIREFARIAALADVYDAMSTDRVYRKRLLPQEVIEFIRDHERTLFDPELSRIFLQNIAPFPIGSMVLLNNSEKGVVIKVSKDFPARPVVKVIFDKDGKPIEKPFEKDLTKELTLFVIKSLKDEEAISLEPASRHSLQCASPE